MAYTETTTTGYGTRVGNSFKAIGSGLLLFVLGTALLWWNEGRAVKTEKMLDEAGSKYVEMENPNKKDASLEGELICGTAMATTEDSLTDADFGIGAKAIALRRSVEYYQWVEHAQTKKEDKLGGKEVTTTTYTYSKQWVSSPVQSSQFHDPAYQNKNTVLTTVEDADQYAENVSFGAYKLPESLIHSISSREAMEPTSVSMASRRVSNSPLSLFSSLLRHRPFLIQSEPCFLILLWPSSTRCRLSTTLSSSRWLMLRTRRICSMSIRLVMCFTSVVCPVLLR